MIRCCLQGIKHLLLKHRRCLHKKGRQPTARGTDPAAEEIHPANGRFANFKNFVANKISRAAVQEQLRVKTEILLLDVSESILIKNN